MHRLQIVRMAGLGWLLVLITALRVGSASAAEVQPARHPNIVFILSDDLGYGDCGCYGGTKIKTPNIDSLAGRGLRFTDGHATASTCTPSRYSIMTGQYAWRKKGTGILPGDASIIVPPGSVTLGGMLQKAGYTTAAIGKWHLGLGQSEIDWNRSISPGPNEVGFTYSFIIPATADRVPCVFVENHDVVNLDPNDPIKVSYKYKVGNDPTGKENPELLKMKLSMGHDGTIVDGISRIGWMSGGKSARWVDEQIAKNLTAKATHFIEQNKDHPFFLYFATHDIHVPHAPDKQFAGSSECGIRGDAIQQLDWSVGQVMETLDRLKLAGDTLVIFSSDNGPVVNDGYADGSVEHLNGHMPAGALRGGKYSIYEGGTRVPLITAWSGHIKPGTSSDSLVSQVDLLSSIAALTGESIPAEAAPDSFDLMPALLGESASGRETLIEQSGGAVAMRKGLWKFVPRARPEGFQEKNGKGGARPELYDLSKDIGETHNVAGENPGLVDEMRAAIELARQQGRTRKLK